MSTQLRDVVKDLNLTVTRDPDADVVRQMQSGLVVNLHIGRWRATKRRTLEDLGINWTGLSVAEKRAWDVSLDLESLGTSKLLPKNYLLNLQNVESQARHNLLRHGLQTRWGMFVPVDRLKAWYREDQRLRAYYLAWRDQVTAQYDAIRQTLVTNCRAWAPRIYQQLNNLKEDDAVDAAWVESYADRFAQALPSKEQIAASFVWEHEFHFLPLPDQVSQETLERERILNELEIEAEQKRILQGVMRSQANDAREAKQAVVDSFMQDVKKELALTIDAACSDILESFHKDNTIVGGNIRALRNLLDKVSAFNVIQDEEIESQMAEIRQVIGTNRPFNADDSELLSLTLRKVRAENLITLQNIEAESGGRPERMTLDIELPGYEPLKLRRNRSMRLTEEPA